MSGARIEDSSVADGPSNEIALKPAGGLHRSAVELHLSAEQSSEKGRHQEARQGYTAWGVELWSSDGPLIKGGRN